MMTVKTLKEKADYEFECNMTKGYKDKTDIDEWGCAFAWINDDNVGVEYNFCMDEGESYCAIYKTVVNEKTGYMETETDTFIHYDIDFDNEHWKEELENVMCRALIEFFNLK